MGIGKTIKKLRIENKFTQAQLARSVGTCQNNISRWERGLTEPSAYYLKKIATFYNVTTDFILGAENEIDNRCYDVAKEAISSEERKIINAYRALPSANQQMIIRMLNIK